MNIRTILLIILTFNVSNIFSQDAPNLKFQDIFGNNYQSYEITENGQFIFFDFFSNGCSSCHLWAPIIDTFYMDFGCGCGDIAFFAMNTYETSTNDEVFNFTQEFNVNFPAVSGEGNSSGVGDLLDIPYVPYFILISPSNEILLNKNIHYTQSDTILDTLHYFGIVEQQCEGTEIKYFELRTDTDTFPGVIDNEDNTIDVVIPENIDLENVIPFFISSSKSNAFIGANEQISGETIVDFSDSTAVYEIFAEVESISETWIVNLSSQTSVKENISRKFIYPNPSDGIFYLSDYELINQMSIYNTKGKLISKYKPSQKEQNFSVLPNGIYIILINSDETMYSEKIIIK